MDLCASLPAKLPVWSNAIRNGAAFTAAPGRKAPPSKWPGGIAAPRIDVEQRDVEVLRLDRIGINLVHLLQQPGQTHDPLARLVVGQEREEQPVPRRFLRYRIRMFLCHLH